VNELLAELAALPGLSATHNWRDGLIVFGDNQGALPRFKLDSIKGLWSTPDSDDNRRPLYGQMGEYPTPARIGGKTIVYTGRLQAADLGELEYWAQIFKHAQHTGPQLPVADMVITRHPDLGGHDYRFTGRLVQAEMDDEQDAAANASPTPWQRGFVVSFRLGDPRIYVTDVLYQQESNVGNGNNNPTLNVANAGLYDAVPIIRITGPIVQPRISRPGALLAFDFALGAGEWADIDFATRTVTKNTGADLTLQRDAANSTWWDAGQENIPGGVPGPTNTLLTLTTAAGNPGNGSKFRVTFNPAV
jgi:hypothetical protein